VGWRAWFRLFGAGQKRHGRVIACTPADAIRGGLRAGAVPRGGIERPPAAAHTAPLAQTIMHLTINREHRDFGAAPSGTQLLENRGLDPRKVALERNLEIVPKSAYAETRLADGDRLEIVHFIGGGDDRPTDATADDSWTVAGRTLRSRLIVGTGKYKTYDENR